MTEELQYLIDRDLNISYACEDVIEELQDVLIEDGNIQVNVFYKIIDLSTDISMPLQMQNVQFNDNSYPIYIDYLTDDEIKDKSLSADLKELNSVRMSVRDALDLFNFQYKIIK